MSKGLIIVADRCMGCHTCFTVCKEENQVAPNVQWNHVERIEHEKVGIIDYFRVSCMHCDNPACMKVCPMKAIYKGPHGEVLVDDQKCIGCHMCEKACPYHAPKFADPAKMSYFGDKASLSTVGPRPENKRTPGKAEHCTLCVHRTSKGLLPACAAACPAGAIVYVDYDNPTPEAAELIKRAQPINEAAGTHPKVRFVSSHTNFRGLDIKA